MASKIFTGLALVLLALQKPEEFSPFRQAIENAEKYLSLKNYEESRRWIDRALERDGKSVEAWDLRARCAEGAEDKDEQIYALHTERRLLIAQKAPKEKQELLRKKLLSIDPVAADLLDMNLIFINKMLALAEQYEKEGRPHSAIRVHREILAIDPERTASEEAIQKISASPDPSLAESAKPKNLFEGISEEWMREFDKAHDTWETRGKLTRQNYVTHTDAGYAVMLRAAEAMEQMNAFYRIFFHYGTPEDGKSVSRIELYIFKNREEYLKIGTGPPANWSAGQFTGSTVETYITKDGFEESVGTLFHEAAHQFVSLATTASGWLNEALASFFEGTRILANGTVIMNLPANHRLFPLVERMSKGWMSDYLDGGDPKNQNRTPERAPTFRIILENKYDWGPPWYAPTWGVVYFLFNYQDPVDGRFIYRAAFRKFINSSGGRSGQGAVENFEKIVLANPQPPTQGVDFSKASEKLRLPQTADELNELWKDWLTKLRDEQAGKLVVVRPYLQWARHAMTRNEWNDAMEHFEKGLVATPADPDLLLDFAGLLASQFKNLDRATKLALQAIRILEAAEHPDEKLVKKAESLLARWDAKRQSVEQIHQELGAAAKRIVQRYMSEKLPMMAMDVSWRLGSEFAIPGMAEYYEEAARQSKKTLTLWKLAYNEKNLEGWATAGNNAFIPDGVVLNSKFGEYVDDKYDYQFLALDTVTSGDFSFETEVLAEKNRVSFCGLVFGKKGPQTFHAMVLFPGRTANPAKGITERNSFVDLTSFYGSGIFKIWRHNAVDNSPKNLGPGSSAGIWHKLRLDITGPVVDVWFDNELVVTQEFSSLDVLRGNFGLITGPGEARYRNIRYLGRSPRDIGASLERKMKMEKSITSGGSLNGSWLGMVPPWPKVSKWIQAPRKSWGDKGAVPTLLAFWTIQQNETIPIHEWLASFQRRYEDIGLEIVSVVSIMDSKAAPEYIKTHHFPGSVGVDSITKSYIGDTFTDYAIDKFFIPRLVLLDLDQKVIWEGDPGFRRGASWKEGEESYLDSSLNELDTKRNLKVHMKWRRDWANIGLPSLREGNLELSLPLLLAAKTLDANIDPTVADAQRKLEELESAVNSPESVALSLSRAQREPALEALLKWVTLINKSAEPKARGSVKNYMVAPAAKSWTQVKEMLRQMRGKLKSKEPLEHFHAQLEKMAAMEGPFAQEAAKHLGDALASNQTSTFEKALNEAENLPAAWLAREYFKW